MTEWYNFLYEIVGEESDLCGEEFLVAVNVPWENAQDYANGIARTSFPNEEIRGYGYVTEEEAEMMGLDTY